ncbi:MAG: HAMP domain-containing histidine kinase, partial [Burkholderiales bacterium]|nr:HAMP domain-containing histidine kinase [Burkholderiales bacterium]
QIGFRHRDQSISQCRVSGSLFNADDEVYLLLASKNIDQEIAVENARVVAENLRRENQQKYSMLFQSSPIPLGLMNVADQKIVEVNDIWLKHFSLPYEITHDIFQALPGFWADGDQPAAMLDSLQAGNSIDQLEVLVRDKEGRHIICLMSARLLEMHNSLMCIFSLFDVTRQYQVEQEIREMTAQLEDRVRLRTIGLQQANVELASAMESLKITQDELIRSEKMAALGSLVAGVAHELNTPIGNSVTVASTLQDKTQELLADISAGKLRRSVLDQYLQSAEQGTSLLMRTLGVARELIGNFKQVAVDQASNQRRKFDLRHVLDEVLSTLAPMYKNGPFNLITDLEADIEMDSYPGPLGQIITNFMTNALNHAFEGRTEGQILIVSRRSSTDSVEIVFEDNGVGIEEAEQKRVFDPFYTTKLGQGGSGLGMNIAYNLVTGVLGGEIRLFSQPGKGTRFTLDLPCIAPELAIEGE